MLFLFLKGMTGALAPFTYLVTNICLKNSLFENKIFEKKVLVRQMATRQK